LSSKPYQHYVGGTISRLQTASASSPAPFASPALGPSFPMESLSPRDLAAEVKKNQAFEMDLLEKDIKALKHASETLGSMIRRDIESLEKKNSEEEAPRSTQLRIVKRRRRRRRSTRSWMS